MEDTNYLGEEKISKLIIKFSIPCILSLLISSLYNIVDQIFIGNSELSTLGNAATGVVFPIFIIAQAFAWCFGDGCAAYLNICQGKNETDKADRSIGTGITLTLASSIVLMAIFYPFRNQILTLLGASENSMGYAIEYFNIVLAFFPFYMLSNMINSVIRADGRPSGSMISISVGAIINIILDPIFIFAFHWGMKGAAWATAIGQVVSFVISIIYLCKSKTFKLKLKSFIPDFKEYSHALKLGISTFITQATIVVIALVCNVMLAKYGKLSRFGEDIPIAVISIETKVFTLIISLVVGVILGCQPVIGYNLGAKKYDRVKTLYKDILIITAIISVISTILVEAIPRQIAGIFGTPQNIPNPEDYWVFAEKTFRIFLSLVSFVNFIKMTSIFFQAVGKPIQSILCSVARDAVFFIPLVIILPKYMGIDGILYAGPIADIVAMILTVALTVIYFKNINKNIKLEEMNA